MSENDIDGFLYMNLFTFTFTCSIIFCVDSGHSGVVYLVYPIFYVT